MAVGAKTDQTRVCLLRSGRPLAWSGVVSGLCSSPGPEKPGKHVTAKKCNWPQAQFWGLGGHSGHLGP